ncbi:type II toxin-antitoxin system HicB family antitoxin [Mesorhizobium sp. SP-1A]|uniref:type II toxin-antitoxin system HicB family antitoxin n=1 Tax=Mesorhizobium sp. SP-1A TaxID=3077840 RepID=UPI0028F72CB1|nr:type II toxin-antitoxin system HicB family antitoxin [Mesorhizobium sp. SP-1A]
MANKYATEIFWSDEDEGFIAIAPDLPGCSAFGETMAEAATEIEGAISAWIEAARAAGNPIPPPIERNPLQEASGKTLLRMPKELHRDLQRKAQRESVSLNSYICFLLTQRHYHAHAVAEFGKSLEWQVLSSRQGAQSAQIFVLNSMNLKTVNASTLDQKPGAVSTPVAGIGMTFNA